MKRAQFDFIWIFAILAGGAILVLAIYGAVKTGDTLKYVGDTEAAQSISILTDPMQAGFSDGKVSKILFRQETRLNNICFDDGRFGKNSISIDTKSGVGEEWTRTGGGEASIYNKYIFSEERNEGFDYYVFSKPFDFPYKVSDLIFLMSGSYCFLNAPDEVEEEITGLGIENIVFSPRDDSGEPDNCSSMDERVCFGGGSDCDTFVYGADVGEGVVSKGSENMNYVGSLMYGAIFSDEDVYECNVGRLMYRTKQIAEVFSAKADLMNARGCGTNLKGDLISWSAMVKDATSEDLIRLKNIAEEMGRKNDREVCGMW